VLHSLSGIDAQHTVPYFKRAPAAFVTLIERQIAHRLAGNEFVLSNRKLRLAIYTPPGARVEVDLIQHKAVGEAGVQRHGLRRMRVPIDDVLRPAIPEIRLGQSVRIV